MRAMHTMYYYMYQADYTSQHGGPSDKRCQVVRPALATVADAYALMAETCLEVTAALALNERGREHFFIFILRDRRT